MGRFTSLLTSVLMALITGTAYAVSPTVDSINVQGYMKRANGTAVTNGSYNLAYGLFQNGALRWCKIINTTITNGLFAETLDLNGSDCTVLPAGTGMNGTDYSSVPLDSTRFTGGTAGSVMIRVYAVDPIDSTNPQFDLPMGSVPTAFIAEVAKGVEAGSITANSLSAASVVSVSAGAADTGKIVKTTAGGLIDNSLIDLSALTSNITTSGNISQSGTSTFTSGTGNVTLNGNTTIASANFSQTGTGTFSTGTGAVALNGAVTASSAVALNGATTLNGSTLISGGTTVSGAFLTTGSATLSGANTLSGATVVSGPLTVSSGSDLSGATTLSGSTVVSGSLTASGPVSLSGAATLTGANLKIGGTGTTSIEIGTTASGTQTITVGSTATAANSVTIQSGSAGKIKLGSNGIGFSALGGCTTVAYVPTNNTTQSALCSGMPHATATLAAVHCSGNATYSVSCRQHSTSYGWVQCQTASANTRPSTFACMWMAP